jgi:hypothetical protein
MHGVPEFVQKRFQLGVRQVGVAKARVFAAEVGD